MWVFRSPATLQVAAGVTCFVAFVIVPSSIDVAERIKKGIKREGPGTTRLQQLVFDKRLALRKLADDGDTA